MTSNGTSWSFPPALNATFVHDFYDQYALAHNGTEDDNGVISLLLAAVQNLTLEDRVDSEFQNEGWGGEDAVVTVGDTIDGGFKDAELRVHGLNCVLCKTGRGLGSVENACSNYTEGDNIQYYAKREGPAGLYLDLPELDQYSSLPNETCGLCIFSLPNEPGSLHFQDYSVPFLVQKQEASQRKVFNGSYPTGIVAPRSSSAAYPSPPSGASLGKLRQDDTSKNPNLIVGVVVGVLAAASIVMGLLIWLWTRRRGRKNPYDSAVDIRLATPQPRDGGPQSVPLQQVQPVVRRPDSAGDVPPAYHEVVRAKETEP
ncbi:hypothetical protein P171DRAFT_440895 [Karstenula rhodostoma CBS 690.94]|uniref:Uncharacterized protein n=1 Tax=Karstenula rhodostoma CBS 690.94 TaxID=1392251 RepID=A0A9P4PQG9_9PLEO|nr:hypothetical protein P171DRAFT_440895 [Karstenula rhodostoma CBS 690.94]